MKLYDVIYADPPWRYNFSQSKSRRVENHYPTMKVADIAKIEVPARSNSVCYLWATAPKLKEGLFVLESWGFEYKSHAVWDKEIPGMGHWWRGQHELLLVGTKGKFSPPHPSDRISSVWLERRGKHSEKPKGLREWIQQMFPNADRIELFARDRAKEWDAWGNEV